MDENKEIDWYYNTEDHDSIVCPYCGQVYKPSLYGYAHIGSEQVDCYNLRRKTHRLACGMKAASSLTNI